MKDSKKRIYTGQGDKGFTQVLGGQTVPKDDVRVKTYGALDELQSQMGMARALVEDESIREALYAAQKDILVASTELASPPAALARLKRRLGREDIVRLEKTIDRFAASYALPDSFVIPGTSRESAAVHVARTVCRRCERLIVTFNKQARAYDDLIIYFNRLSDLLFVLAWALEVSSIIDTVVHDIMEPASR